jgi:protein required for attachment to host cells
MGASSKEGSKKDSKKSKKDGKKKDKKSKHSKKKSHRSDSDSSDSSREPDARTQLAMGREAVRAVREILAYKYELRTDLREVCVLPLPSAAIC